MSARPKKINASAAIVGSIPLTIADEVVVVVGVDPGTVDVGDAPLDVVEAEPVALVHATLEEMLKLSAKVRSAHCRGGRHQHPK
jgi:hypothetical protein